MALLQYLQSRVDDGSNFNLSEAYPFFQHVLQIPSIADLGDDAQGLLVLHTSALIEVPDSIESFKLVLKDEHQLVFKDQQSLL